MSLSDPEQRLAVFDLSIALENLLMRELSGLNPVSIKDNLETLHALGMASAACGYLEFWEWEQLSSRISIPGEKELVLDELLDFFDGRPKHDRLGIWDVQGTI